MSKQDLGVTEPEKGGQTPNDNSPIKELNQDNSKSSLKGKNSDLEYLLISSGKISKYLFKPSDIETFYKSTKMKAELVNFFQELYKPKSQFEQEKVEYN